MIVALGTLNLYAHEDPRNLGDRLLGLAGLRHDQPGAPFLGNFPQGLVHLALVSAAIAMHGATG